jgi:hypothetical protein
MTPSELSAALRKIAAKIDASKNPSRELVISDIQRVASRLVTAAWQPHKAKNVEEVDMSKLPRQLLTGTTMGDIVRGVLKHMKDEQPVRMSLSGKGPLGTDISVDIDDGQINIKVLKAEKDMKAPTDDSVALSASMPLKDWVKENKAAIEKEKR